MESSFRIFINQQATSNQDDVKTAQRVNRHYEFSIFTARREAEFSGCIPPYGALLAAKPLG